MSMGNRFCFLNVFLKGLKTLKIVNALQLLVENFIV